MKGYSFILFWVSLQQSSYLGIFSARLVDLAWDSATIQMVFRKSNSLNSKSNWKLQSIVNGPVRQWRGWCKAIAAGELHLKISDFKLIALFNLHDLNPSIIGFVVSKCLKCLILLSKLGVLRNLNPSKENFIFWWLIRQNVP